MFYERYAKEHQDEPMVYYCDRDVDLAPGIRYGPVIRDIYIVECCTGGYGSVIINDREFPLKSGDCFVLLPGDTVIHTADTKEPRCGVWCAIDGFSLGRVFARAGITSEAPFAPPEAFGEISSQLEQLILMRDETDPGADLRRTACIYSVLGTLLRTAPVSPDKNFWIQKAIGIMETRYHEALSVQAVANEVGLDRSYFSTLFKSQTGRTPHEYLTSLRIKKACTLIRRNDSSVGGAAASVGLDPQNFARLFKRETGKTPREYKKEI